MQLRSIAVKALRVWCATGAIMLGIAFLGGGVTPAYAEDEADYDSQVGTCNGTNVGATACHFLCSSQACGTILIGRSWNYVYDGTQVCKTCTRDPNGNFKWANETWYSISCTYPNGCPTSRAIGIEDEAHDAPSGYMWDWQKWQWEEDYPNCEWWEIDCLYGPDDEE